MYKHILISTDGSEVAQKGVDHGLSLAKSLGAKVTIITVTEPYPYHMSSAGVGWVPGPADVSLYQEGQEGSPKMMSIGLHCRLVGRPGRAASLRRFVEYVLKHDDVWVPKRIDIARHWHAEHRPG